MGSGLVFLNYIMEKEKIKKLKKYFKGETDVLMAFVFGSQAKGLNRRVSDWDIGVYFKPEEYLELETERDYPNEDKIRSDLIDILETDEVDFVVLNRAKSSLVYNILREGLPLIMKSKKLYLDLLCKVSYEAMDWWQFVADFYKIREIAKSISPEARTRLQERLTFLETQFEDINHFKELSWEIYRTKRDEQRNVERWVENLVIVSLDIAKIILASEKREIPQSYKDTLKVFTAVYIDSSLADKFSTFAEFRNIIVHEYLDIRWKKIVNFIKEAEKLYPKFIEKVKKIVR